MSSIFTDDYKKSLSRVYALPEKGKSEAIKDSTQVKSFGELLSSIENKRDLPVPQQEASAFLDQKEILTNLTDKEQNSPQKLKPDSTNLSYIIGDIPLEDNEQSVKYSATSDKKATGGELPETPKIISSERFNIKKNSETASASFPKSEIKSIIETAGKYHGVDPSLGLAVAQAESSFRADAVSSDGFASKGIFQLLDSTAKDMQEISGIMEPYQPFDPSMNSFLGMGYLRRLHDIFSQDTQITSSTTTVGAKTASDLEKIAVAAYNAGEGNVARAQAKAKSLGKDPSLFSSIEPHIPAITRTYVNKVSSLREQYATLSKKDEVA